MWFAISVATAVLVASALPHTILSGDPAIYRERMAAMFGGGVPYVNLPFEHFPGAIIPMALSWLLGGFTGESLYLVVFSALMVVALWITGRLLEPLGRVSGISNLPTKWLVQILPLLPLVIYRNDPWVVMLTIVALWALLADRGGWFQAAGTGAIISKAWPVALIPFQWWRGRRRSSVILAVSGAAILMPAVFSAGYRATQTSGGIQAETLVGSLIGLGRITTERPLGLILGLNARLEVGPAASLVNAIPGLVILLLLLRVIRFRFHWHGGLVFLGALTAGMMLTIPVLSAQFLLWLTPFVAAADRGCRRLGVVINTITVFLAVTWLELVEGHLWWWTTLAARNALLVWLGIWLGLSVNRTGRELANGSGSTPSGSDRQPQEG